jgi:hypothetical protein
MLFRDDSVSSVSSSASNEFITRSCSLTDSNDDPPRLSASSKVLFDISGVYGAGTVLEFNEEISISDKILGSPGVAATSHIRVYLRIP